MEKRYIFKIVNAVKFDDWINERANEGYVYEWMRMLLPSSTDPAIRMAVLMSRQGLRGISSEISSDGVDDA